MAKKFRPITLLPVANLIAAVATCIVILAGRDWVINYKSVARTLDIIARASLPWLVLAYAARPLNDLLHLRWTRWLVKNRRYLGLSFAAWFLQHLWLLPLMLVSIFGGFWNQGRLVFPLVTLLLATFLAVTSFDRAQRSLPGWRIVHWLGMQMLLVWFFCIYVRFYFNSRHSEPYQLVYVVLILAGFALRAGGFLRRRMQARDGRRGSTLAVIVTGCGVATVLTSVTLVSFFDGQKKPFQNVVQLVALIVIAGGIVMWQLIARREAAIPAAAREAR